MCLRKSFKIEYRKKLSDNNIIMLCVYAIKPKYKFMGKENPIYGIS